MKLAQNLFGAPNDRPHILCGGVAQGIRFTVGLLLLHVLAAVPLLLLPPLNRPNPPPFPVIFMHVLILLPSFLVPPSVSPPFFRGFGNRHTVPEGGC